MASIKFLHVIETTNDDSTVETKWYKDSNFTHPVTDRPFIVSPRHVVWVDENGSHHSPDNNHPARTEYNSRGDVIKESWFDHGLPHREDGLPAVIHYTFVLEHVSIQVATKEYWISGVRHREDGPAIECVNGDDNNRYYLEGELLSREQWRMSVTPVVDMTLEEVEQLLKRRIRIVEGKK